MLYFIKIEVGQFGSYLLVHFALELVGQYAMDLVGQHELERWVSLSGLYNCARDF